MMPMKYASSDMKSPARPRKETTRLNALATGLRLMTTATPKTSMSSEKIQKRNADITQLNFELRISNFEFGGSFLFVPFQNNAVHHASDFQQLVFVMHHLSASESGNGIIFAKINSLFGTDLLAHTAENAADHVDIEFFGIFFDLGEPVHRRNFARNNFDCARWTNELE